jgi:acyl transferase domain-containing protein
VQYVEAHGTGTPVGDPREARGDRRRHVPESPSGPSLADRLCHGERGHLEAAAGIVGVIKTALALEHRQIPPTVNFGEPNPAIPFDELLLRVPTALEDWPAAEKPAIAGVNSFGFGGANGHVVLEEPPARPQALVGSDDAEILTISARSREALRDLGRAFAQQLRASDSPVLRDLCYTAAVRRCHHEHRLAVVGSSNEDLAKHLDAFLAEEPGAAASAGRCPRDREPKLAFVFSGMGPQWWGMGRQLMRDEPVFRSTVEECDRLLCPLTDWSLLEELGADESSSRIVDADLRHVANLAIQVALAALWRAWGIVPDAVVGHSSGEMGAACAAGALALPNAVRLAYHRGRLQHRTTGTGGMLAAGISPETARELLEGHESQLALAAVNGPQSVTLSGELEALGGIADSLKRRGHFCRLLSMQVPYHSPQMDPLRDELMAVLADINCQPPTIPIVSTVTGAWQDGKPFDAAYWWRNVRQPVLFASAIDRLSEAGCELRGPRFRVMPDEDRLAHVTRLLRSLALT